MTDELTDGAEMAVDDLTYFRRRARVERELAYSTENQEVAAIHANLARQYQSLIARLECLSPSARTGWLAANEDRPLWHNDWNN